MARLVASFGIALLCAVSVVSRAAVVTIDFSGTVADVSEYHDANTPSFLDGSLDPGVTPFSGRIVYDTALPSDVPSYPGSTQSFTFQAPPGQLTVSAGSYTMTASPAFQAFVYAHPAGLNGEDELEFAYQGGAQWIDLEFFGVNVFPDGSLAHTDFGPIELPNTFADFGYVLYRDNKDVADLDVALSVESLHATVPEPGAAALAAAGLALALAARRRWI